MSDGEYQEDIGSSPADPRPTAASLARCCLRWFSTIVFLSSLSWLLFCAYVVTSFPGRRTPHWASSFEFPLSDPTDVIADHNGRIYVHVGFHSRIQVYDSDGAYLFGFFLPDTGAVALELGTDGRLNVFSARGRARYVYDQAGRLVKTQKGIPDEVFDELYRLRGHHVDAFGRSYVVRLPIWKPAIERIEPNGKVSLRIQTPAILSPFIFPMPCFATVLISAIVRHHTKQSLRKKAIAKDGAGEDANSL